MDDGYWFRSLQFHIQDGEDAHTNPGCYGKSLAEWLAPEFAALGYDTEVIAEDWGWCVMCVRGDFLLWIACGAMTDPARLDGHPVAQPATGDIVWHVFTAIEVPFFRIGSLLKKWMGRLDLIELREKLNLQLDAVLKANASIVFCEEP